MIALLIILLLVLLIICGILFIPVEVVLNTDKGEYAVKQALIFKLQVLSDDEYILKARIRIFFVPITIYPFKLKVTKPGKQRQKRTKKKKNRRRIKNPYQLFLKILNAFKIKRLNADIDTGNFPLNAQLYPIAQMLNGNQISININYQNELKADIYIVTQLYKLAMAGISHTGRSKRQ